MTPQARLQARVLKGYGVIDSGNQAPGSPGTGGLGGYLDGAGPHQMAPAEGATARYAVT